MKPLPLFVVLVVAARGIAAVAADRPNVVLVTLDTTRADRMGFLGSTRGATPQLDLLAKESVVFERAYAQAPITTVSHATILSGTLPQLHKVNDFGVPLPAALPYLPDLLRAEGYRTAAFVGSLILDPRNGLAPGFDRGFEVYDAGFKARRGKESRYDTMERRGGEVVTRALAWLAANAKAGPFLLWVHLYDAHDPYDPPEPWKTRFAKAPYDGEIAYVDTLLGKLVAGLRAERQLERTALLVLADHGESLGEHGESTHGVFLYDSTLHVPLLIRLPGPQHSGRRVAARVSLVDVLPTVLEAVGLTPPPAVQGESLLPLVNAARPADRASYAETDYPRRAFGWSALGAWRVERFLFVKSPRRELYDLGADPAATRNLAEERSSVADRIQEQMEAFRTQTGGSATASAESPLDPALAERLAALGYVSGATTATAPAPASGIDPKDRIGVSNTLHEAILAVEGGEFARASALLAKVVASDPQIPMAQLQLGLSRARQRQFKDALAPLRKAILMQPENPVAHYEMGLCLFETGDWKTSAGHFEIVVSRMPKFADARFSLGSVYARIDRVPEAMKELEAALALEPEHYRANLLLGRLLTLLGQPADALSHLKRAASKEPGSSEAQAFLGDAYEKLGRGTEAAEARARAQQLRRPGAS